MGATLSGEVFKPPTPPKYDYNKEGLMWISSSDPDRKIPLVCYAGGGEEGEEGERKEEGKEGERERKEGEGGGGEDGTDDDLSSNSSAPFSSSCCWNIVYCKGGTEDIGMMDKWLRIMAFTLKVNVWSFDYAGFGLNHSSSTSSSFPSSSSISSLSVGGEKGGEEHRTQPSEKLCYDDTVAVFRYLVEEKKIPSSRIIMYGRSVGSAPALKVFFFFYSFLFFSFSFFFFLFSFFFFLFSFSFL